MQLFNKLQFKTALKDKFLLVWTTLDFMYDELIDSFYYDFQIHLARAVSVKFSRKIQRDLKKIVFLHPVFPIEMVIIW